MHQSPPNFDASSSEKIQKSRRLAVDGMSNDKKSLKMLEVLASRLFQLANTYILEAIYLEKDRKYFFFFFLLAHFFKFNLSWDFVLHNILEVIAIERNLISESSRKILSYLIASKAFYGFFFIF